MPSQIERLLSIGFRHRRGRIYSIELEHYTVDVLVRPASQLVVCFDHAGIAERRPDRNRAGWGFKFIRDRTKYAGIFVKPTESNWYRAPGLFELCDDLVKCGFLGKYGSVMTYGGSMGGYGSLAYADAFTADRALSMNPQATLAQDLVPWEKRFSEGRAQSWENAPRNAVDGCRGVDNAVVVYDRIYKDDAIHADLLDMPQLEKLNLPFVGHGIPYHLAKMGVLEPLFFAVAEGDFDLAHWRREFRKRRETAAYKEAIEQRLKERSARV